MKVRSAKLTIAISILLIEPRVLGEDAKSIRDLVLAEMPEIQSVKNFDELSEVLQQNIIKLSPKTLNSLLSYCEKDFSEKISSLNKPELIFKNKQKFLFRKELWGGIKYDFEKDLFSAVVDKQSQELKTQAPIGVYWLLNGPCNLKCIHCYGNVEEFPRESLSESDQMIVAQRIIDSGAMRVTLAGGEPLLRKDTPLIIEKLVEHNISVVLGTNGTYLTNEMMPTIKKTSLVEISLDSHDEFINNKIRLSRTASGNAFKETLKAIDLCVANQVKLKILTSLNNKNYSDLIKIADLIYTRGVRVWGISWTLFAGRAKQIYKEHVPVESKNISNEIEQTLNLIQMKYPDLKIKYSNRSNSKENNRFSFLIFPNGQAFAEDLNVGQKFPFYSLVASPLIKSWTEENYNIKQHFKRWVSDRIEIKGGHAPGLVEI